MKGLQGLHEPFVGLLLDGGSCELDAHLDLLRPAIKNYGGSVEVLAVEGGTCELRFDGPKPLAAGIQSALKDKFPDIGEVVWHGLD